MESYSVCQLRKEMRFEGFLLVRSAEKRKDVKGNDYVDMNLTDRTGEINCKIWNWDPEAEAPETGNPIKVRGTIQEYNGRLQLRVEKWREAAAEDPVDMSQLVPCAPRKPEDMMQEIRETVAIGVFVRAGNMPVPLPPNFTCSASRRSLEMRSSSICESP